MFIEASDQERRIFLFVICMAAVDWFNNHANVLVDMISNSTQMMVKLYSIWPRTTQNCRFITLKTTWLYVKHNNGDVVVMNGWRLCWSNSLYNYLPRWRIWRWKILHYSFLGYSWIIRDLIFLYCLSTVISLSYTYRWLYQTQGIC